LIISKIINRMLKMKVVVLCGGKGTRYGNNKPKSLAMIGDKPILHHLLEILYRQGYNDFILAIAWKGHDIIDYFNSINHNYKIEFVYTKQESNTGGRLKEIEQYVKNECRFLCMYCDGLANINIKKLYEQNKRIVYNNLDPIATMTVVQPYNQFGVVSFNPVTNRVIEFIEKPKMNEYVNAGFFIFTRHIFNYIDKDKNESLESDVLPKLVKEGRINVYKHERYWDTLNTPKDEIRLNEMAVNNKMEWYNL
ncbi:NTP transferase domain-containing protein, partial [Patescibacteria group bacterium]|nr:NTP transferase domain-containing protein [Patescibacteria group bacterium]